MNTKKHKNNIKNDNKNINNDYKVNIINIHSEKKVNNK